MADSREARELLAVELAVDLELGGSEVFLVALEHMMQLEVLAAQLADLGRVTLARGGVGQVDEFAHVRFVETAFAAGERNAQA